MASWKGWKPGEAHEEAKKTISAMLESGSSSSACAELATTLIDQVTESVKTQQESIEAFRSPNDGSECLTEGQDAVTAAKSALDEAKTKASLLRHLPLPL